MDNINNDNQTIEKYAGELMRLARDTITVRYRFFDTALAALTIVSKPGLMGFATDGSSLYYDPSVLLRTYLDEPNIAVRLYLHVLLHCVFFHQFQIDKLNPHYWDLAADIAVENIILEMDLPAAALTRDGEALDRIQKLKKWVPDITAEKLYREFMVNNPSRDAEKEYYRLFTMDSHDIWRAAREEQQELIISEDQWKKITERIRTELKAFSKDRSGSESLEENLEEASREKYDYRQLLEKFMVSGEELSLNDDEFDYIYYTYGLRTYGNIPLIEPLEYKETNKVREFVIAIDTSASCRGSIVRSFLRKTYDILRESENFFRKINVHIIQCDAKVTSDTKITSQEEFEQFVKKPVISGYGNTDFRPVFQYVEELTDKGEFENLKGLIYFTDGYGIYPERMPAYDVIFAFLNEDSMRTPVPPWAIGVVLDEDRLEDEAGNQM